MHIQSNETNTQSRLSLSLAECLSHKTIRLRMMICLLTFMFFFWILIPGSVLLLHTNIKLTYMLIIISTVPVPACLHVCITSVNARVCVIIVHVMDFLSAALTTIRCYKCGRESMRHTPFQTSKAPTGHVQITLLSELMLRHEALEPIW